MFCSLTECESVLLIANIHMLFKGCTVCLRGRGSGPLLDAVQVEDVEAALAAPHRGHEPDDVAANHALILLLGQLLNKTPCGGKRSEGQETRARQTNNPQLTSLT